MARLRLPHWLRGSRKLRRRQEELERKRPRVWFYRPQLEQLEDRLAPGSLLVNTVLLPEMIAALAA
jgi:hypothetical protein